MAPTTDSWLVGSRGLHEGRPPDSWTRASARQLPVLAVARSADSTLVGVTGGLWELRGGSWVQRHDETLTEVLAVRRLGRAPGVAAGCPYGVAFPAPARGGAWRWSFLDAGLSPDERFTNALLEDPADGDRLWVGTEAGLAFVDLERMKVHPTNLAGTPVRALLAAHGELWAGSDTRGVWRRGPTGSWAPAGAGLEGEAVFSLAAAEGGLVVAGTARGVAIGDGAGSWRLGGPRLLVSALAVAGDTWLAGASPGGLWWSTSAGRSWEHLRGHAYVRAIAAPAVAAKGER